MIAHALLQNVGEKRPRRDSFPRGLCESDPSPLAAHKGMRSERVFAADDDLTPWIARTGVDSRFGTSAGALASDPARLLTPGR